VEPFDYSIINAEIRSLDHGRKRSAGTPSCTDDTTLSCPGGSWGEWWNSQAGSCADHRRHLRRIEWITPGVVWAMDGTQYDVDLSGKLYLCNLQDLGRGISSCPWQERLSVGERMAEHLMRTSIAMCPLVLKRDNEGI